jgi:hypothetical protein
MSNSSQPDNEKILRLVGAIVLVSQDAERYLKITLPFTTSEDPSLDASLKRHEKLKKRTLGELAGKFVDSSTSDSLVFARHMAYLVATRNQVVHHFNETYGAQISAGAYQEVFDSLETLLANLKIFRSVVEQLALVIFEGLRDVTFRDTPEYEQMAALCASFRARIAS